MNNLLKILGIISLSVALFSCTTTKEVNLMQERDAYEAMTQLEDYKLQVYDQISCMILTSNTDFAKEFNAIVSNTSDRSSSRPSYTIYENGRISIPYFGEISVLGLTIAEAEAEIQRVMVKSYKDAEVVVKMANKYFYVVSSTNNARVQVYKDNMTIFQALAVMGRVDDVMDFSKVKIVRMGQDGRSIEKTFDLRTTSIIESEYYYIQPNDVIYFSTSGKRSFFQIRSATQLVTTIVSSLTFIIGAFAIDF